MPCTCLSLAKVMTQANDNDISTDQVGRRPGQQSPDFGGQAGPAAAGRTDRAGDRGALAVQHAVRRAGETGEARPDEPRGAGRVRKGAAALHDPRYRHAGGVSTRHAGGARLGQASGGAHRDSVGPGSGDQVPAAQGRVAGEKAGRADPAGADDAGGRRADPGEAQPVLTGAGDGPQQHRPGLSRLRTFHSLGTRNYRLFATGQVVSNSGTWMQRVAQDWLVLQLTHGSGTALGIATGLQFLPMLASPWGGAIADRYPKRRILMLTQTAMGLLALI